MVGGPYLETGGTLVVAWSGSGEHTCFDATP